MTDVRRESRAPWIVAGIAGVVLVALVVVFFAVLLPYRRDHHPGAATRHGRPDPAAAVLTGTERAAMTAAGTEAANLLSYTRKNFQADYARAVAGATGKLRADVTTPQRKQALLKSMTDGKFDLSAKVQHTALVGPTNRGNGYDVLVTVYGYTSKQLDVPIPQTLSLSVVNVDGKWLASDLTSVGTQ
jgi:hypothetical protein